MNSIYLACGYLLWFQDFSDDIDVKVKKYQRGESADLEVQLASLIDNHNTFGFVNISIWIIPHFW